MMEEQQKKAAEIQTLANGVINTLARLDIRDEFLGLTEEEFNIWDQDHRNRNGTGLKEWLEKTRQRLNDPKLQFEDEIQNLKDFQTIEVKQQKETLFKLLNAYKQERGLNYLSFDSVMGIYDDEYAGLTGISISCIHWDDNNIWCSGSTESGFDVEELKIEELEINLITICERVFKALYEDEI